MSASFLRFFQICYLLPPFKKLLYPRDFQLLHVGSRTGEQLNLYFLFPPHQTVHTIFPYTAFLLTSFLNHISLNRFNFRSYNILFCNRYIILIYHITSCYSISSSHIPSFPFVSSKIFLSSSLHNLLYMRSIYLNFLF